VLSLQNVWTNSLSLCPPPPPTPAGTSIFSHFYFHLQLSSIPPTGKATIALITFRASVHSMKKKKNIFKVQLRRKQPTPTEP
jgi:hypothetical protein